MNRSTTTAPPQRMNRSTTTAPPQRMNRSTTTAPPLRSCYPHLLRGIREARILSCALTLVIGCTSHLLRGIREAQIRIATDDGATAWAGADAVPCSKVQRSLQRSPLRSVLSGEHVHRYRTLKHA